MQAVHKSGRQSQNTIETCKHYRGSFPYISRPHPYDEGIFDFPRDSHRESFLLPLNDKECICQKCKTVFPIERYNQMIQLIEYLHQSEFDVYDEKYAKSLLQGFYPVQYRYIG